MSNTSELSLPRRKSAQRAGDTLKKFVLFQSGGVKEESDSDGFVGDEMSESSSEDESEGVDSNEEEGGVGDEDCESDDGDCAVLSMSRLRRAVWDTVAAHSDITADSMALYSDKMAFLEAAEIQAVEYDEEVNISVNSERLPAFSSIDSENTSIGYAGGTVLLARWVPNSALVCLAVCNSTHVVTYKTPIIDSIQLWRYRDNQLTFLHSVKVPVFQDFIVYPFRAEDASHFTLCISCKNCVQIFRLPIEKADDSGLHFIAKEPSFQLNIGTCSDNSFQIANLCWSLYNEKVHILAGLNNGYIVIWDLSCVQDRVKSLSPCRKVWAHPGHPVSGISVCPQMQNLFCSIAQDSRIRFWDVKNLGQCLFSQTRPQKQLLLPARIHWCSFWSSVLALSMMPVRKIGSSRLHANTNMWQFSTAPLHNPSRKVANCCLPRVFPPCLSGITPRCFDFCDATSVMVVGFQSGLVAMWRVSNLWMVRGSKDSHPRSGHFLYLSLHATVKSGVEISKEFRDDQDFINHFEFSLPTKLSPNISQESSFSHEYSKKSLISVTHVEVQKEDSESRNVCVGYMSGLFQVLKPPGTLHNPKGKL